MKRIKVLLVGLGQIGAGYDNTLAFTFDQSRSGSQTLSHARALACHSGFDIESGIDPCPIARQKFSIIYDIPTYPDIQSWQAAQSKNHLDMVILAVPPQIQPRLVREILSILSVKFLLLEKPIASNLKDAELLMNVCSKDPNMTVAVNYIRSWLPSVQAWKQRIKKGEFGSFLHGKITYGKGLLTNGSHFVNLAETWLGSLSLERVLDLGISCLTFDREASLQLRELDYHNAYLQVQSVGSANLRAGELDLWFESGRICWLNEGTSIAYWPICRKDSGETYARLTSLPEVYSTGIQHYQHEVLDRIYSYINTESSSYLKCTLKDGMRLFNLLSSGLTQIQ